MTDDNNMDSPPEDFPLEVDDIPTEDAPEGETFPWGEAVKDSEDWIPNNKEGLGKALFIAARDGAESGLAYFRELTDDVRVAMRVAIVCVTQRATLKADQDLCNKHAYLLTEATVGAGHRYLDRRITKLTDVDNFYFDLTVLGEKMEVLMGIPDFMAALAPNPLEEMYVKWQDNVTDDLWWEALGMVLLDLGLMLVALEDISEDGFNDSPERRHCDDSNEWKVKTYRTSADFIERHMDVTGEPPAHTVR